MLEGRANLHRIPTNGGTTARGLAELDAWLGHKKWDVIHFNWGLHDLTILKDGSYLVSLDQYEKNLRVLAKRLKSTGAGLIWASTTPVPKEVAPVRSNDDTVAYNAVAQKIMEENGIAIDDLYAFALPKLGEIQMPADVHFTEEGSEVLAEQVAASILAVLKTHAQD